MHSANKGVSLEIFYTALPLRLKVYNTDEMHGSTANFFKNAKASYLKYLAAQVPTQQYPGYVLD